MTTHNHGGYTESADKIAYRAEQRKAREIAYEVFNASQLTDAEIEALDAAVEAVQSDPAHIQKAFSVADAVTAELQPKRLVELPAPKLNTLQALADAQEQSFNLRYYNNGGLPYFKHQKGVER